MDTFDFPYHRVRTQYPNNSDSIQFGGSYESTSRPRAPDQRLFILNFAGMKYFFHTDGTVDTSQVPEINYKRFQEFYEAHGTWDSFTYPHPIHGDLVVRFGAPLADPEGIVGGEGAVGAFEIQLKEQP